MPILMCGYRQHAVRLIEGVLHTVTVVSIDVNIGDPLSASDKNVDCQHNIVNVTEPGCARGHGVVQSTGRIERDRRRAREDVLCAINGCSSNEHSPFVHARKDGIVRRSQAVRKLIRNPHPRISQPECFQVAGIVKRQRLFFCCLTWLANNDSIAIDEPIHIHEIIR